METIVETVYTDRNVMSRNRKQSKYKINVTMMDVVYICIVLCNIVLFKFKADVIIIINKISRRRLSVRDACANKLFCICCIN